MELVCIAKVCAEPPKIFNRVLWIRSLGAVVLGSWFSLAGCFLQRSAPALRAVRVLCLSQVLLKCGEGDS